jgi:TRAP-type C4-dicarboxylate transport system permease small subunit
MAPLFKFVFKLTNYMYFVSGVFLTFVMLLTVSDVVLRYLGRPIPGTYELVALSGAIVVGFAIPYTSWVRGHVFVEFLVEKLSKEHRRRMMMFTKALILLFFVFLGVNLILLGESIRANGQVSLTLQIPFYPVAYGLGICSFLECLVMFCDILRVRGGEYE